MSGIRRLRVISRPTVVWWWDRDRDTDVPRLHAVCWLEIDGPRDGLIRVVARECDPEDPDDVMIQMELQLQSAIHFSGQIELDHASRHLDELDPLTRISAHPSTRSSTTIEAGSSPNDTVRQLTSQ